MHVQPFNMTVTGDRDGRTADGGKRMAVQVGGQRQRWWWKAHERAVADRSAVQAAVVGVGRRTVG